MTCQDLGFSAMKINANLELVAPRWKDDYDSASNYISTSFLSKTLLFFIFSCHFTKAHCSNRELTIKQTGPCQNERVKQEIVLSLVCNDILAMDCSMYHGTSAYCGTDGRSYNNV